MVTQPETREPPRVLITSEASIIQEAVKEAVGAWLDTHGREVLRAEIREALVASASAAPPKVVHVAEAARLLGMSENTLYRAINRGEILRVKVGRRAMIPRAEIDRLVAGR